MQPPLEQNASKAFRVEQLRKCASTFLPNSWPQTATGSIPIQRMQAHRTVNEGSVSWVPSSFQWAHTIYHGTDPAKHGKGIVQGCLRHPKNMVWPHSMGTQSCYSYVEDKKLILQVEEKVTNEVWRPLLFSKPGKSAAANGSCWVTRGRRQKIKRPPRSTCHASDAKRIRPSTKNRC